MKIKDLLLSSLTLAVVLILLSCTKKLMVPAGEYMDYSEEQENLEIVPIDALANPDRGFHLESNFFAHNFINPFNTSEVYPDGFIDKRLQTYRADKDGIALTQLYIYLTEWVGRDITPQGLDNIQKMFDGLGTKGFKAILRFAYNYTGLNTSGGESEKWILRHIEQLQPLFKKNAGLIATVQIGFLGAWGEWHTSPLSDNQSAKNNVVRALLEALPQDLTVEIRYPTLKNALTLPEGYVSRIGYANDYFTAGGHSHAPGNDFVPGDDWYKQVHKESPYLYVSGEIPYAEQSEWGLFDLISTSKTLQILRDHHYSAFDITQNFELNITSWKQQSVTPSFLRSNNILFSDDYFKDSGGRAVARTYFDFVRDHLGYRLNMLPSTTVAGAGGTLAYDFQFTNTGFAKLINPKPIYLVFINEQGQVVKEVKIMEKGGDWQPFDPELNDYRPLVHQIKGTMDVGLSGEYSVGLWMPEERSSLQYDSRYAVKWASNPTLTHWSDPNGKYVVNVVGKVNL